MKKATMSKTKEGSPDGREVFTYHKGVEYDLTDELYNCFDRLGALESITVIPSKTDEPKTETAHIETVQELHEKKRKNSKKGVK